MSRTPETRQTPAMKPAGTHPPGTETITLRGRKVVGGVAEGEALVTTDRISGWGGVDPRTGTVVETRHQLRGQSFAGKVLVFPGAKGSSGWSAQFHMARMLGTAPAAWLFNEMTTKVALGTVVSHAPAMTDFDRDPLEVIRTGDHVRVDADAGIVTITRRQP
jgi:predicted aconitase with swiveling domain